MRANTITARLFISLALSMALIASLRSFAADRDAVKASPLLGRWDLTVNDGNHQYPSWVEIRLSGFRTLVGSYVGQFGSVRPIGKIDFDKNSGQFHFTVPPQWERRTNDILVQGKLDGDVLKGDVTNDRGTQVPWDGRRAPSLVRNEPPKWGTPIPLISGKDL